MKTYRIGKLIYCNTRVRHDLANYLQAAISKLDEEGAKK